MDYVYSRINMRKCKIEYLVATSKEQCKEFAEIALKSKLYYAKKGMSLYKDYCSLIEHDGGFVNEAFSAMIILCKSNNKYIGVALVKIHEWPSNMAQVFVKEKYRRQGIGTELITAAKKHHSHPERLIGSYGPEGSIEFFKANELWKTIRYDEV